MQVILESAGGSFRRLDGSALRRNDYREGQKVDEPILAAGFSHAVHHISRYRPRMA